MHGRDGYYILFRRKTSKSRILWATGELKLFPKEYNKDGSGEEAQYKLRLRSQSQIVRIHEKLWECLHTPVTLALGGKNRRKNGADWLTRLVEVLSDKFSEGPCFNKQNNEEMIEEGIPIMV